MKKCNVIVAAICICLLGGLVGCGEVASEADLKRYAKIQYGEAEFLSSEKGEDSLTCYFRDEELGFEYYVTSYLSDINIDGTHFGVTEGKQSDYEEKYFTCIAELVMEDKKTKGFSARLVRKNVELGIFGMLGIISPTDSTDTYNEVCCLGELLREYDKEKRFEGLLYVVTEDGEENGSYDVAERIYLSPMETEADFYMESMKQYVGKKPKFLYHEKLLLEEVPGIATTKRMDVLGAPEYETEGVDVYYFELDDATYFITNYYVYEDDEYSTLGIYYNSYTKKRIWK